MYIKVWSLLIGQCLSGKKEPSNGVDQNAVTVIHLHSCGREGVVYILYIYIYILHIYIYILHIYIIYYIYICSVGVTSLYRVLDYRALNKYIGFQIKQNNFFGT